MNVLICDDEEIILKMLVYHFQLSGYSTVGVLNGRDAKNELSNKNFDLIISDVLMPYNSGLEVLDFVRNELLLDTPFIFLSRTGSKETIDLAYKLGADYFMLKPFDPEELQLIVTQILSYKLSNVE